VGEREVEIGIDSRDSFPRFANNSANVEKARRRLKRISKTRSVIEVEL
jgi:hypothetical protein